MKTSNKVKPNKQGAVAANSSQFVAGSLSMVKGWECFLMTCNMKWPEMIFVLVPNQLFLFWELYIITSPWYLCIQSLWLETDNPRWMIFCDPIRWWSMVLHAAQNLESWQNFKNLSRSSALMGFLLPQIRKEDWFLSGHKKSIIYNYNCDSILMFGYLLGHIVESGITE